MNLLERTDPDFNGHLEDDHWIFLLEENLLLLAKFPRRPKKIRKTSTEQRPKNIPVSVNSAFSGYETLIAFKIPIATSHTKNMPK